MNFELESIEIYFLHSLDNPSKYNSRKTKSDTEVKPTPYTLLHFVEHQSLKMC